MDRQEIKDTLIEMATALREDVHKVGTKVMFNHNGKTTKGKVVRHDRGSMGESPFYVVDHGAYESAKVPAHKVKLAESSDEEMTEAYSGKHPKKIKTVASSSVRGAMNVVTNDGSKHVVTAAMSGGKMPKPGDHISQYIKESALEVPDIHIDAAHQYTVVGGEQVKGKIIKYVRMGNFLAPISVVVEEEMWKDADGSIFKFAGQAAAQQAIHALLSGGGSHVVSPKTEDGGEQGPDGGDGGASMLPGAGGSAS